MAGIEVITGDDVEDQQVPACALRANVVKLLEVEQRRDAINLERNTRKRRANMTIFVLYVNIFYLFACVVGRTIYLPPELPFATAFSNSIPLGCLFLATIFMYMRGAKLTIASMNWIINDLTERDQKVRIDARILMELERKRRLASDVVDTGEGPLMNMDCFITKTRAIYDAPDFPDFEKVHYKNINFSWVLGGVYVVVLVITHVTRYYELNQGYDSSFLHKPT